VQQARFEGGEGTTKAASRGKGGEAGVQGGGQTHTENKDRSKRKTHTYLVLTASGSMGKGETIIGGGARTTREVYGSLGEGKRRQKDEGGK